MNKLVPVEPTKEMVIAWHKEYEKAQWNANSWDSAFSVAYKAMLEASPPVEVEPVYQIRHVGSKWQEVSEKEYKLFQLSNSNDYLRILYTSPPNLEAKLKLAVEALRDICNKEIRALKSAEVIAKQALKDIGEIK